MYANCTPELPTLAPGLGLLAVESGGAVPPLATLVCDHLLAAEGRADWIDSRGHARTDTLARLAPSARLLDRVRVARGFTPHQHAALLGTLPDRVDEDTTLLVVPAMDGAYRTDDLSSDRARRFMLRGLATLATVAREHDVPVLLTRTRDDDFAAPLATAADQTITCRRTDQGPRFETDDFETLVYPRAGGVQTTLAFWREVLAARRDGTVETVTGTAPTRGLPAVPEEVTVRGAD